MDKGAEVVASCTVTARVEGPARNALCVQSGYPNRSFSGFAPYDPETDFPVYSPTVAGITDQPLNPRRIRLTRPLSINGVEGTCRSISRASAWILSPTLARHDRAVSTECSMRCPG